MLILPLERERLRAQFQAGKPFPHVVIDNFLDPARAAEIAASYPTFERARQLGDEFRGVNEHGKIQITDAARFPAPVQALNQALGAPELLAELAYITGIDGLRYDPTLAGGGIHVTGPRGRLDVHVLACLTQGNQAGIDLAIGGITRIAPPPLHLFVDSSKEVFRLLPLACNIQPPGDVRQAAYAFDIAAGMVVLTEGLQSVSDTFVLWMPGIVRSQSQEDVSRYERSA